jgi:hypothetical protein
MVKSLSIIPPTQHKDNSLYLPISLADFPTGKDLMVSFLIEAQAYPQYRFMDLGSVFFMHRPLKPPQFTPILQHLLVR